MNCGNLTTNNNRLQVRSHITDIVIPLLRKSPGELVLKKLGLIAFTNFGKIR